MALPANGPRSAATSSRKLAAHSRRSCPCGGCGATRYRRVKNGYTYPDGGQVDGWFCGSPDCGVKLLTGYKAVDNLNRPTKRK